MNERDRVLMVRLKDSDEPWECAMPDEDTVAPVEGFEYAYFVPESEVERLTAERDAARGHGEGASISQLIRERDEARSEVERLKVWERSSWREEVERLRALLRDAANYDLPQYLHDRIGAELGEKHD